MGSRRGLAVTAGILGAVTAASFAVWIVPQGAEEASFVVTDHGAHLDGVKNIHATIMDDMDEGYGRMLAGEIEADEYAVMAEASSEQMRAMIVGTISADPPAEWRQSYEAYIEALRQYNTYIRETAAVAAKIAAGGAGAGGGGEQGAEELARDLDAASRYKTAAIDLIIESDRARP